MYIQIFDIYIYIYIYLLKVFFQTSPSPRNQFLSWTVEDVEASYFSFFFSLFLNSSSSGKRHSSSPWIGEVLWTPLAFAQDLLLEIISVLHPRAFKSISVTYLPQIEVISSFSYVFLTFISTTDQSPPDCSSSFAILSPTAVEETNCWVNAGHSNWFLKNVLSKDTATRRFENLKGLWTSFAHTILVFRKVSFHPQVAQARDIASLHTATHAQKNCT